jgi:hypothetical protein
MHCLVSEASALCLSCYFQRLAGIASSSLTRRHMLFDLHDEEGEVVVLGGAVAPFFDFAH